VISLVLVIDGVTRGLLHSRVSSPQQLRVCAGTYKLQRRGPNGEKEVLYSFANSVDTNFKLPPKYDEFPFNTADHHGQPTNGKKVKTPSCCASRITRRTSHAWVACRARVLRPCLPRRSSWSGSPWQQGCASEPRVRYGTV
jgi:hypothetical protein